MLNRSASVAMSTSVLKALPGKLDIKRHSPSILYIFVRSILTGTLIVIVSWGVQNNFVYLRSTLTGSIIVIVSWGV